MRGEKTQESGELSANVACSRRAGNAFISLIRGLHIEIASRAEREGFQQTWIWGPT